MWAPDISEGEVGPPVRVPEVGGNIAVGCCQGVVDAPPSSPPTDARPAFVHRHPALPSPLAMYKPPGRLLRPDDDRRAHGPSRDASTRRCVHTDRAGGPVG